MLLRVPTVAVPELFENMPPEVREFLKVGYSHLAAIPVASLDVLANRVEEWLDPACAEPDVASLARDLGVDVETIESLKTAVMLQTTAIFSGVRSMPLETFVTKAINAGALKEEHAAAVKHFGDEHLNKHHADIGDAMARAQSSTHIVPSFRGIDATIDLRVATVREHRVVTMPMAIIGLQTDVPDRNLIFQMTARDIDQLLRQLKTIEEQLAYARNMTAQETRDDQ